MDNFFDADKLDALLTADEKGAGGAGAAAQEGAAAADADAAKTAADAAAAAAKNAGAQEGENKDDTAAQAADDKKDKPDPNKPANEQKNDDQAAADAAAKNDPTKQDPPPPVVQEKEIVTKAQTELLKQLGFSSLDELKTKLEAKPPEPETPEQKKQREEKHIASINKYAVEKGFMSNADIVALNNMKNADPATLVKKEFAERFRNQFKDRKDTDGDPLKVTDSEIDEAFESLYHTGSDNPLLVEEGKRMLAAKAGELTKGLSDNYEKAQLQYEDRVMRQDKAKEYFSLIKKMVADFTPPDIVVGEGDDKAVYQFDNEKYNAADKAEIEKLFVNEVYFDQFLEHGADQKLLDQFKDQIKMHLRDKHFTKIVDVLTKVRADAALKDASKVGAKQPFKQAPVDAKPLEVKQNSFSQEELTDLRDNLR